jgi:hypothetical protein
LYKKLHNPIFSLYIEMEKSTSVKFSIFIAFVIISSTVTINGSVYAQQSSTTTTTPPQQAISSSNTTAPMGEDTASYLDAQNSTDGQVVRDSSTVLLESHQLPKVDFIHLYDTTPDKIVSGHVAAKLPCNSDNSTDVKILVGQAPNLHAADTEFIPELSVPGALCLYHVDLMSNSTNAITDIAIQNNSTNDITFPPTSTVVIGVNKIAPLPEGEEEHEHA